MVGKAHIDLAAMRRQLEYYFSDSNLPRDKFLRAKTEENEHGYVDIPILLSFKRLQALGATPTSIAAAAADSNLLALDDQSARIRRTTPLPKVSLFNTRAVFAKGWIPGSEPPSIDELSALFSPSGKVLSIRIRRWVGDDGKKHFKGSIFVEMETPEAADRVVAEQYQIDVPGENDEIVKKQLLLLTFDDYTQEKKAESKRWAEKKARGRGQKRKRDDQPSKKDENEGSMTPKTKNNNNNSGAEEEEEGEDGKSDGATPRPPGNREDRKDNTKDREMKPGLILKCENFGPEVSREDIREAFEPYGEIAWVDFQRGNSEGYLRFARFGDAKAAREAMIETKIQFGGNDPTFTVLEGEEEEAYWKQMWDKKDAMIEQARKRRREGGRGGHGGRGSGRRFRGRGRGGPRGRGRS